MTKTFLLLALCLTAVASFPTQPRIVNGTLTTVNQYPYIAVILALFSDADFLLRCGATIINNRSVLTAAHCFFPNEGPSQIRVRVGSSFAHSGGNIHFASLILKYPNYDGLYNDIGIVRVSTAFSFGANVQVARIAGPNYNPGGNQIVWATGWGLTIHTGQMSEQLRHVQIQTSNQCVNSNLICAGGGGRGICVGDSGGPLIHNNVVIGITSHTGIPCGDLPSLFTRISSYTEWIQRNA